MEVEHSTPSQSSSEEEDELHRSVKKFKESNGASSFLQPRKLVSYKDSLVGDIPEAYEQAFRFDKNWEEEDYESDTNWNRCWKVWLKLNYIKKLKLVLGHHGPRH